MRFNPNTEGADVPDRRPTRVSEHGIDALAELREIARSESSFPSDAEIDRLIDEVSDHELEHEAALLIAEHTGQREYLVADDIADVLGDAGVKLSTAERLLVADVLRRHGL